jgi:hypothetical protein
MRLLWADDKLDQTRTFSAVLEGMNIDIRYVSSGRRRSKP